MRAYNSGPKRLWLHVSGSTPDASFLDIFINISYWRKIPGTTEQFGGKNLNQQKGLFVYSERGVRIWGGGGDNKGN